MILIGDIDRGGVIAQMAGTAAVLGQEDLNAIKGFVINKFRGDPQLFEDGYEMISEHTGWPGFGVVPWFPDAWKLPAEDALDIASRRGDGAVRIVCLGLSRIANFDDLDPLAQATGVSVEVLRAGQPIPGDADLVILPGSKSTRGDLAFLREQGWDIDLTAHHRRGGRVLGICGGFQMLGRMVHDPDGIEGPAGSSPGLGLLDVETVMTGDKRLTETDAVHAATGLSFTGYEIHIGRTEGADRDRPFAHVAGRAEGAQTADGRVAGSYLHGMFRDDAFRAAFLRALGAGDTQGAYAATVDTALDDLATHLESHLDVEGLIGAAR